jgi:predicted nuclease with TOPRIM domain
LKQEIEKLTLENKRLTEKSEESEQALKKVQKRFALIETEKALLASRLKKAEQTVEELYAELE